MAPLGHVWLARGGCCRGPNSGVLGAAADAISSFLTCTLSLLIPRFPALPCPALSLVRLLRTVHRLLFQIRLSLTNSDRPLLRLCCIDTARRFSATRITTLGGIGTSIQPHPSASLPTVPTSSKHEIHSLPRVGPCDFGRFANRPSIWDRPATNLRPELSSSYHCKSSLYPSSRTCEQSEHIRQLLLSIELPRHQSGRWLILECLERVQHRLHLCLGSKGYSELVRCAVQEHHYHYWGCISNQYFRCYFDRGDIYRNCY